VRLALRLVGQEAGSEGGALALLCKANVARKALGAAWRDEWGGLADADCSFHHVDARRWFGASVAAGLLLVRSDRRGPLPRSCREFESLAATTPSRTFGWRRGELLAEVGSEIDGSGAPANPHAPAVPKPPALAEPGPGSMDSVASWRSGVKHDAAAVFEFRRDGNLWRNGLGACVELEREFLFPLLKATDLHHGRSPTRWLLVPQQALGEDPTSRLSDAPLVRSYLARHGPALAARKSRLWRTAAPAWLFGIGPYAFTPWKLALSALHLPPRIRLLGPSDGRPVLVDDTACLLPCPDAATARLLAARCQSSSFQSELAARLFPDRKRPVTISLLDRASRECGLTSHR
jgi:hypothetical protein